MRFYWVHRMWRGGVGGKRWIVDGRWAGERALRVVGGADPYREGEKIGALTERGKKRNKGVADIKTYRRGRRLRFFVGVGAPDDPQRRFFRYGYFFALRPSAPPSPRTEKGLSRKRQPLRRDISIKVGIFGCSIREVEERLRGLCFCSCRRKSFFVHCAMKSAKCRPGLRYVLRALFLSFLQGQRASADFSDR